MKLPETKTHLLAISAIAAGGVFGFGLPWFVLPVALGVFFYAIIGTGKHQNFKKTLWLTSIFFWLYYAVVLRWFLDIDATLLAGIGRQQSFLLLVFSLIVMSTVLTLASLPLGVVLYALQSRLKKPDLLSLLVLVCSWALIEWLRSIAFSAFLYAPEASVGDYWNFGSLGLGIITTPLGYFSRIVGMYGLSMLTLAISLTLYWAYKKQYRPFLVVFIVAVAGSALGYRLIPTGVTNSVEARLLQGEERLSGQEVSVPIRNKSDKHKDLIVLPEYSRLYSTGNSDFTDKYVNNQLSQDGVVIDVSADFINPGPRNSFLVVRNKERVIDSQTKRLLIPTGEYLPNIITGFYRFTGQQELIDEYARTRKLEKGQYPHVVSTQNIIIAPVACSGILGRNIYRQLVNDGGEVLTNSASLATFKGSKSYFRQSVQMARFHAVANNRAYIQATIGAPAFVIDSDGRFILAPDGSATEFADFDFTPRNHKTIYTKYGDWPLLLAALTTAGFTGSLGWNYLRGRRKN